VLIVQDKGFQGLVGSAGVAYRSSIIWYARRNLLHCGQDEGLNARFTHLLHYDPFYVKVLLIGPSASLSSFDPDVDGGRHLTVGSFSLLGNLTFGLVPLLLDDLDLVGDHDCGKVRVDTGLKAPSAVQRLFSVVGARGLLAYVEDYVSGGTGALEVASLLPVGEHL